MAIKTRPPQRPPQVPADPKDHQRFVRLLEANRWRFAKTMADIPHSYTRGKEWESRDDFTWACAFILAHGYQQRFFQRFFTYYDVGEHQYWIMAPDGMTDDPERAILINRAVKGGD